MKERIDDPLDPALIREMLARIPDFRRAYEQDGMNVDEFERYGAAVHTLRGFISSYHELEGMIRGFMLPNPDVQA